MQIISIYPVFFFFQAEDGIRDLIVTGVQTCALPIYPHGLPERVPGVAPDGGWERHLCAAKYWASASSWDAFIITPKVFGMMPASFSYPGAIEDVGSRIFLRIDSASRREPTCVRSGAITCPWPSSLWQARHPAAWMTAWGSVLPPA